VQIENVKLNGEGDAVLLDAISQPTRITDLSVVPDVLHALCYMHEGYSLLHLLQV
jgi:hypothetical protein